MASIDERVVSMAFENAKFEQGVSQTMRTLAALDKSLQQVGVKNSIGDIEKSANKVTLTGPMSALEKLKSRLFGAGDGASRGFSDIERAGNKVTLDGPTKAIGKVERELADVGRGAPQAFAQIDKAAAQTNMAGLGANIDQVTAKFSVMQGAAAVALGNIASQAAATIASLGKQVTGVQTMVEGYQDYELKIGATQTIMAGTGENIGNVTKYLKDLDIYADRTIYSLKDMTGNIGKFTNAGVKLPIAVDAMKGISNVAALSGAGTNEAARAMYNLGQAIGQGTVRLMDWRSVELANMGTKEFKEELINGAVAMGSLKKSSDGTIRSLKGNEVNFKTFSTTLQDQWLTSEALTKTLRKYSDESTTLGKRAYAAATNVKTFSMMMTTLGAAAGTGWTDTFDIIIGNLPEATKLFTGVTTAVGGFLGKTADARNHLLEGWKELGGRKVLIEGLKDGFQAIFAVLKPIGVAFRDVFPRKTSEELFAMTKRFADFTRDLKPGAATIDGIKRTFRGLFAVLHIGWSVVKGVIGVITQLLGVVAGGSGGFLNFTGSIGDFLVAVDVALTQGGLLTSFFDGLAQVLKLPLSILGGIASAIFGLFGGVDSASADKMTNSMKGVGEGVTPLKNALVQLEQTWKGFLRMLRQAKELASPWLDFIGEQLSGLGALVSNAFSGENFAKTLSIVQTGFVGGIFIALKRAFSSGVDDLVSPMKALNDVLGGLSDQLGIMQTKVKSQIILNIATALALLTASIFVMSKVDGDKMVQSLTGIATGLGLLAGVMYLMGNMMKGAGMVGILVGMPILSATLLVLAGALVVLAGAMKIFATMSWDELARGLVGVAGGLVAIAGGMKLLGPGTVIQGPAILVLAVAMNALAVAVRQFASLSWEELGRGLAGVLGSLVALAVPMAGIGPGLLLVGPGLIAAGFGLNMIAGALKNFSDIDTKSLIKGLYGMFGALATLGLGIMAIPPTVALQAAGLVILGVALSGIAGALKMFGSMSVGGIAKGLVAMGGALAILAIGVTAMTAAGPGALALIAVAAGMAVLAPTLGFMGTLNWKTIISGLAAMALTLGVLAAAGALAAPGITALGIAMLPLAAVFVLTAGAAFIFAKAVQAVAGEGAKGFGVLIAAITAFALMLPNILIQALKGFVGVIEQVALLAPKLVTAIVKILDQVIEVVIRSAPRLGIALGVLIQEFARLVDRHSATLVATGWRIILELLKGLDNNMPAVIQRSTSIITKFLSGLASQAPKIIASGAELVIAFLQGVGTRIASVVQAAYRVAIGFVEGIGRSLPKFVEAGVRAITGFLGAVAEGIPRLIRAGVRIVTSFLDGVSSQFDEVAATATRFVLRFFRAFGSQENTAKMVDAGLKAAINILRGISQGLRQDENIAQIISAASDIGFALVEGIVKGLAGLPGKLKDKLMGPIDDGVKSIKNKLGIKSPSKVFEEIGSWIGTGLEYGLVKSVPKALKKGMSDPLARLLKETKGVKDMGAYIGKEFATGLAGGLWGDGKTDSQRQIEASFQGLKDKLAEEQKKLHDQIKAKNDEMPSLIGEHKDSKKRQRELLSKILKDRAELDKLSKGKNTKENREKGAELVKQINADQKELAKLNAEVTRDARSIMKQWGDINEDKRLLNQSKAASDALMRSLEDEQAKLISLGHEYENVSKALEDAKRALDEATQARDDAIRSYTDQYSTLPDVAGLLDRAMAEAEMTAEERYEAAKKKREDDARRAKINQVANYKKALEQQIKDTQKYMETLGKLRAAGLDDVTYKKLLQMGTAGQEFASQLLSTGPKGIDELNKLNADLAKAAAELAKQAANDMYQAGVDAAQGLVDGLANKQAAIRKTMEDIAGAMIAAIKNQLGIRSPSRIMAQIGKFSVEGMARGLKDSSQMLRSAAAELGDDAAAALTNSLANISDGIQNGIDTDLTITPVLDLSQVQRDASKMQDLTNVTPITAAASFGQASAIAQEHSEGLASAAAAAEQKIIDIDLIQHNTSPKALDDIEIYRKTNNQLSQLKSALGLAS